MSNYLFIYVVDRDFGFAPNPFHGYCTLATCKAPMRKRASIGDWVLGVGGGRLKATGKCIYLMEITEIITYNDYWQDPRFQRKKPLRNGSLVMMVGDNIYHRDSDDVPWTQEDSQHSNSDGSPNIDNVRIDTKSDNVLISNHFYYFGESAIDIDLERVSYKNGRNYRRKPIIDTDVAAFINEIKIRFAREKNLVVDLPINFLSAAKRVDQAKNKII